jgi:hypothetical protein
MEVAESLGRTAACKFCQEPEASKNVLPRKLFVRSSPDRSFLLHLSIWFSVDSSSPLLTRSASLEIPRLPELLQQSRSEW